MRVHEGHRKLQREGDNKILWLWYIIDGPIEAVLAFAEISQYRPGVYSSGMTITPGDL